MRVQKLTPESGVMIMQVQAGAGALPVARATKAGDTWRVRALFTGHEEIATTEADAEAIAINNVHEAFPGRRLELTQSCECFGQAVAS